LIPAGAFLHGALGTFTKSPESGWKMGGKHQETRRTNYSLLEFMGIDLPTGNTEDRRREAYLQGLQALRRVVVELGGGLLAGKLAGKWFDLAEAQEEAKLLHLLKDGRVFPFFAPGWIDRISAAYEAKIGKRLPKDRDEAQAARWKKPVEEEGFPLMVELKAAMERRKLTQAMAAKELGVSQMTVSRWIKGSPMTSEGEAKIRAWIKE
jgi:DNA-binding transcriptional regulator YiaG